MKHKLIHAILYRLRTHIVRCMRAQRFSWSAINRALCGLGLDQMAAQAPLKDGGHMVWYNDGKKAIIK